MLGVQAKAKKPEYERVLTKDVRPLRLSPLQAELLEHLYRVYALDTEQIQALFPDVPRSTLVRQVRALFDHAYLGRFAHQSQTQPLMQTLAPRGARFLSGILPDQKITSSYWSKINRDLSFTMREHTRFRSSIYVALVSALRSHPTPARLLSWRQGIEHCHTLAFDPERHELTSSFDPERHEKLTVYPDAVFSVVLTDPLNGQEKTWHYALEVDRSTLTHERMLNKFRAWWKASRSRLHMEWFRVPSLVVLTITPTTLRRDNLKELSRQADDWQKGSRLFRFASATDFSPEAPAAFVDPIWHTARDPKPVSLFT